MIDKSLLNKVSKFEDSKLDFQGIKLSVGELISLLDVVLKNSRINSLKLEKANLDDSHADCIVNFLAHNKHVRILDLSDNNFTDKGVGRICAQLQGDKKILEVNFSNNRKATDESLNHFAALIMKNKILAAISISNTGRSQEVIMNFGCISQNANLLYFISLNRDEELIFAPVVNKNHSLWRLITNAIFDDNKNEVECILKENGNIKRYIRTYGAKPVVYLLSDPDGPYKLSFSKAEEYEDKIQNIVWQRDAENEKFLSLKNIILKKHNAINGPLFGPQRLYISSKRKSIIAFDESCRKKLRKNNVVEPSKEQVVEGISL